MRTVADGETVYSNGISLYVASDQRWRTALRPMIGAPIAEGDAAVAREGAAGSAPPAKPAQPQTVIYKFDTSTSERPRFVGGGAVPGTLINQYAMSEWDGVLRVAATTTATGVARPTRGGTQSGVYTF